jgi:hypothetical protein
MPDLKYATASITLLVSLVIDVSDLFLRAVSLLLLALAKTRGFITTFLIIEAKFGDQEIKGRPTAYSVLMITA